MLDPVSSHHSQRGIAMQRIVFLIFLLQAYSTVIAVEQEEWEWNIQNLQKGAERSRTGNQVGAALRVAEDRAGDPAFASSPAGQYLERAKAGDVGVMKDMEWINMMTASGIPTRSAAVGLRQKSSNIAMMTPGLEIALMGDPGTFSTTVLRLGPAALVRGA